MVKSSDDGRWEINLQICIIGLFIQYKHSDQMWKKTDKYFRCKLSTSLHLLRKKKQVFLGPSLSHYMADSCHHKDLKKQEKKQTQRQYQAHLVYCKHLALNWLKDKLLQKLMFHTCILSSNINVPLKYTFYNQRAMKVGVGEGNRCKSAMWWCELVVIQVWSKS